MSTRHDAADHPNGSWRLGKRKAQTGSHPLTFEEAPNQVSPRSECPTADSAEIPADISSRSPRRHDLTKGGNVVQPTAMTQEVHIPIDPHAWRATRWVGAIAGHATERDLLTATGISADHRNSVTRVY